jgi:hypothetical protein
MPETAWQPQQSGNPESYRSRQAFTHPGMTASEAAVECFREYSRERPEVVALWAFGLGFVLGWKLRIW